ncbi:MAG: radical SAM protein [Thermoguttaceae bacterium]|jgi:biotin synthase
MQLPQITDWLRETEQSRLAQLWQHADLARQRGVGQAVHLRGLVELSNHCVRLCAYCGLRAENHRLPRYRMSRDEVLACARQAVALGYGTVVLQSGEDPGITADWMADLVREIKRRTPLAVTLSLGERDEDELALWRQAGADRYLLRFETSNRGLYERIHPPPPANGHPGRVSDRIALLGTLRRLGYEVGSGVMIGIPGQTYGDLARDIDLFRTLDLDMIGVGPYLAHPHTPLGHTGRGTGVGGQGERGIGLRSLVLGLGCQTEGQEPKTQDPRPKTQDQVPATELMTYKVIALARLACPRANIPSTTALATLNLRRGRELGLLRGANVIMPNLTPPQYRIHYEIYPNKACLRETAEQCLACCRARIESLGRSVGRGRGDAPRYTYALDH